MENKRENLRYYGTFGPSCASVDCLYKMFLAGMTGLRLNTSHMKLEEAMNWVRMADQAAEKAGVSWELLIDLEGPELRTGTLENKVELKAGEKCTLYDKDKEILESSLLLENIASSENLSASYIKIPVPGILLAHLHPGQTLLLDDGKIELCVENSRNARVIRGGILTSRKSIALMENGTNVELPSPALTAHDLENLSFAGKHDTESLPPAGKHDTESQPPAGKHDTESLPPAGKHDTESLPFAGKHNSVHLDYVMQPFVRSAEDLVAVRRALDDAGCKDTKIMAKIENVTGFRKLPELLPCCDEVVIARGDLGNAVTLPVLPVVQKQIEDMCRNEGKPFMVVTQMLASMQNNPVPTRAEVSDIGNAVFDGASSLMLTNETAAGRYPAEAVKYLVETAENMKNYMTGNL